MPPEDMMPIKDCLPVTLIFDQIRDPGNFGTLLRTAAAVGCEKVIAVKGIVELGKLLIGKCHSFLPILEHVC